MSLSYWLLTREVFLISFPLPLVIFCSVDDFLISMVSLWVDCSSGLTLGVGLLTGCRTGVSRLSMLQTYFWTVGELPIVKYIDMQAFVLRRPIMAA